MELSDISAKDGISVLYGHRVLNDIPTGITPYNKTTITPQFLDDFLERHSDWQALSLHDIQTENYHPETPAFALTFDDGYRDNLTALLPVLEKHDVPTAIFICDGFCHDGLEPFEHNFGSRLKPNQHGMYHNECGSLKRGTLQTRTAKLNTLIKQYNLPAFTDKTKFLNADDIRAMDDHPLITLGHHTKTHPLLSRLMPWHIWGELQSGYQTIAYPYGGHHAFVRLLAKMRGYQMGFATMGKLFNPQSDTIMAIPRIELKMD